LIAMGTISQRQQHILTGAIAIVLAVALMTVGIKGAFGAFKGGYELVGSFDAAGQGLLPGSDVKIRGVNVGEVKGIRLVDGRAEVTLRMDSSEEIPVDATATIRPKTLFGEKFVDIEPGPNEERGPYLEDGEEIRDTLGGFELEAVLTDLYPVLQAVDPADLTTVLAELAEGGRGLGEQINRSIVNGEELSAMFADNAELTTEFLTDLAALSDQLAASADDLIGIAEAGNAVLPTLVESEAELIDLLQQAGRLSNDVADLLEANPGFVEASFVDGSRTLQVLTDQRGQVVPLVVGLRQYLQSLAAIIRIDVGDGSLMAAVKGILGGELCTVVGCPGAGETDPLLPIDPPSVTVPPITAPLDLDGALEDPVAAIDGATQGVLDVIGGVLGR
jgi:phospholipid/cholesterol/gamma-HCH transport system substrate-binding protein